MQTTSLLRVLCHRKFVTVKVNKFFFFCTNDVMCHALWRHLLYPSYQFSIIEDGGGVTALLLNLKFRSRIWLKPLPKLRSLSISPNWPARPWPDQSFWQLISLFPRVFRAEKPLCMLFRIWLIWLDSYDKWKAPWVEYVSNRPHLLWVYQRDNPCRMLGEHSKSL